MMRQPLHLAGALSLAGWGALALSSSQVYGFLTVNFLEWLLFAAALWWCYKRPASIAAILCWGIAFRLCGLFATPLMEDDFFRYLWDGRQFALTGNPYDIPPSMAFANDRLPPPFEKILDNINYPHIPTIYGPVCQIGFLFSYMIAPGALWPWKVILLLAEAILVWAILLSMRPSQERNAACLAVAWCPLSIFETSFNAHPEMLGVMFLALALVFQKKGWFIRCGVCCALAFGVKVFALVVFPFLLGLNWRAWLGAAVCALALYAPFALQGSWGGLDAALRFGSEWEFNSSLYGVLAWLIPDSAKVLTGALFAVVWLSLAVRFWFRGMKAELCLLLAFGAFFVCSATVNPWYLLWMLPFVVWHPSTTAWSAMALVSLAYMTGMNLGNPNLGNFEHPLWVRLLEYGGIGWTAVLEFWIRRRFPPALP